MFVETAPMRLVNQGTDWPAWVSARAAVATLVVVIVTAWLAFRGLRDARQTRHGQLITELMREWTEPTVVDAIALHGKYTEREIIELVNKMFGPSEERAKDEELLDGGKLILVANMIETLGVLASEKAITAGSRK